MQRGEGTIIISLYEFWRCYGATAMAKKNGFFLSAEKKRTKEKKKRKTHWAGPQPLVGLASGGFGVVSFGRRDFFSLGSELHGSFFVSFFYVFTHCNRGHLGTFGFVIFL